MKERTLASRTNIALVKFDFILLFSVLALSVFGVIFIYSSAVSPTGELINGEYIKQIIWIATGTILIFVLFYIDYRFLRRVAFLFYILMIFLLLVTLINGRAVNNARSWIGIGGLGFQPSEFAKLATIILLATYLSENRVQIKSFKVFMISLGITFLPVLLILPQPDLGTAIVFIPIFLSIAIFAGLRPRYILFVVAIGAITIFLIFFFSWLIAKNQLLPSVNRLISDGKISLTFLIALFILSLLSIIGYVLFRKRYYFWMAYGCLVIFFSYFGLIAAFKVLKQYQLMRLVIFIDPHIDPQGAGWNILQSLTAVGAGGFNGKGFLLGTQSKYNYLPQQSTDFIFSILAEEIGFLGCLLVFIFYMIIFIKIIKTAYECTDPFPEYLCLGILGLLIYHFVENIGMVTGMMPVTGVPLIFLSYGGSSLWVGFIAIGIVISIIARKDRRNYEG